MSQIITDKELERLSKQTPFQTLAKQCISHRKEIAGFDGRLTKAVNDATKARDAEIKRLGGEVEQLQAKVAAMSKPPKKKAAKKKPARK